MVIAAVDQYEEPALVQNPLAVRMLPLAGRIAAACGRCAGR
jgi:hypothetical protein